MEGVVNLRAMTTEHRRWALENFDADHSIENSVLGMGEEFGELCHALLKYNQGIRGMADIDEAKAKIIDAHCDLLIFSFGLCEFLGYHLDEELKRVWDAVKSRNWKANPQTGGNA